MWGILEGQLSQPPQPESTRLQQTKTALTFKNVVQILQLYLSLPILHGFLVRLCFNVEFLASCIIVQLDGGELCVEFIDFSSE